jgi:hypothetical protein
VAIISVSRRTDIPAFHGEWFMGQIENGFCEITKPFNFQKKIISLKSDDVDAFVFWSKNYIPFEKYFDTLTEKGFKFYLNYTVNNYPYELEKMKNSNYEIIENLKKLSKKYKIFWRYDPVYISRKTDFDFHLKNFSFLCENFAASAKRVIINFIQEYPKVLKRLNKNLGHSDFSYISIDEKNKIDLALELRKIANIYNIPIHSCTSLLYKNAITQKSHCVDKFIIEEIIGENLEAVEIPTFSGCHCYKSIDIGKYNTCDNNCVYCYANS